MIFQANTVVILFYLLPWLVAKFTLRLFDLFYLVLISLLMRLSIFLIFCLSPNVICWPSGEFLSHWPTLLLTFPFQSLIKIYQVIFTSMKM